MKTFILTLILPFLLTPAMGQAISNPSLKRELDSLQFLDQKYRGALSADMRGKGDSLALAYGVAKEHITAHLWKLQNNIDSLNLLKIEEIISKHGYPGTSLVGNPSNEVAFYIIQHSKVIDKYLPVIKTAAEKNEISFRLYAMMLDRSLMFKDKEQIYGTQASGLSVKNAASGKWENFMFIWPIKDPLTVNERRKRAGFNSTVEKSAEHLGITYEILTLEKIFELRNKVTLSD
ncbi:DUF6624 domain-containing protein [Niabella insulamsoli]|uniref:DUF6624 domain-containing protein n=1 Tax=Niabella insulamsoli TaxID=3144874 RepID=UPI0031FDCBE5